MKNILQDIMDEVVEMPGFPQLLVTRGWLYQWLKGCGWRPSERGFGSLDYTVFARKAVNHEPTPASERDYWLGQVKDAYVRSEVA